MPASQVQRQDITVSFDVSDRVSWDAFVTSHPQGTPFHVLAWQRMIQAGFGYEPRHIVARSARSREVLGVLPLFLIRSLIFGRILSSTPRANYGGILAGSENVAQAILQSAREMADKLGVRFLELRNFRTEMTSDAALLKKDLYVTFRQELQPDPEANMLAIPRKTRAEVREGIRKGLEFKVGEIGSDEFFNVYSRNVRDLGTPVFTKRLIDSGLREFGANCKIFSVHWQGKLVGAVWTIFYKDEVLPQFGGALREYNHLAVNSFMYGKLINYAAENGYRIFDFGRSKKGTGSFAFKKRWGMTMTDLPYQYHLVRSRSMPDTSPLNPKFSFSIEAWRRLPLALTRSLGPFIARHLI